MNQDKSIDNLLTEGYLHLERSHYDKALEIFQQADNTYPNNPEIKNALGLVYFRQEQYQTSIEYLNHALQLKPDYLSALVRRGIAYKYSGQTELGNVDFEAVLQAEPQTYEDWRSRGIAYDELKQSESALKCYDKALEIKPDDYSSLFNKGLTLQNSKQYELALQCYNLSLSICPDRFFTIRGKAYTLFVLQRYEEALDGYNRAIELKPDDYLSYSWRGATLGNLEQYQEAILSFNTALDINSNWSFAYVKRLYTEEYIKSIESKNSYKQFLLKVLFAINNLSDDSFVNKILKNNSNLLNSQLSEVLESWVNTIAVNLNIVIRKLIAYDIWDLCNYIRDFEFGDRSEIIEIVIATRNIISTILDKEHYYVDWAMNQYNIGLVYTKRTQGNLKDNIEASINHYQNALSERLKTECPQKWAFIKRSLAHVYTERIAAVKKDNLEAAINCYYAALTVYTEIDYPQDWASTLLDLAEIYVQRIKGEREKNLETAINYCNNALKIFNRKDNLENWALIHFNAGVAYLFRIEGERGKNLETAIVSFGLALEVFNKGNNSKAWAMTYLNLSAAFLYRTEGNRKDNLEIAIGYCNNALEVFTEQKNPQEWATVYLNLSHAFLYRIEGDRKENLETAIDCCNLAYKVFTKENNPRNWAMMYLNGGAAYSNRIEGDRKENIEIAIGCLNLALQIFTKDDFPQDWAMIQVNLGNAYLFRVAGSKKLNIETAIESLNEALKVFTEKLFSQYWGMIQINLGGSYFFRIEGSKAKNIELSIEHYNKALRVLTKEEFPQDWAKIHLSLGAALGNRQVGNKYENIEKSLNILDKALEIYTKEEFPQDWATIQNNFGYIYSERIVENRNQNFERAIKHYKNALVINTPQTNPFECFDTANNLGSLAFTRGNWKLAIEGYSIAIEAIETSRLTSTDDARRQEIISDAIYVYDNIVQALINIGQITKAIEYAERSRCRRLVDLMATNDLYSDGDIPPEVAEYLQEYEALQERIDAERNRSSDNTINDDNTKGVAVAGTSRSITRSTYDAVKYEIEKLEAEKQKVWQKIRSLDPILSQQIQVASIPFDDISQLIPDSKTALISCYITANQIQIFVIYHDKSVRLHTTEVKFRELRDFTFNSWIDPYRNNFEVWKKQIPHNLATLATKLNLSKLVRDYLQDIEEIIIIPHLYLHLIPFAALPISLSEDLEKNDASQVVSNKNSQKLLGDLFRIRTLPSAQILQFCHQRDSKAVPTVDYGMVEDADNSLPCSQYEGEQIAHIFSVPDDNRLRGETQATLDKYRELVGRVQVLHSSHHAASRLDNPLESQLILADGTISLGEIMSPGWRLPNLEDVFLSCCETNLGKTELSDDPLTIATGFLCAGARSVVSTLWAVDDLATALFSIIYYQLRKEGLDRPTALQQAQHQLRTMTGEKLEQRFFPQMFEYLNTQHKQIRHQRKGIDYQLNNLSEDKPDYSQVKANWKQIKSKEKSLEKGIKRLRSKVKQSRPFAHPYYWAGFISQGLR